MWALLAHSRWTMKLVYWICCWISTAGPRRSPRCNFCVARAVTARCSALHPCVADVAVLRLAHRAHVPPRGRSGWRPALSMPLAHAPGAVAALSSRRTSWQLRLWHYSPSERWRRLRHGSRARAWALAVLRWISGARVARGASTLRLALAASTVVCDVHARRGVWLDDRHSFGSSIATHVLVVLWALAHALVRGLWPPCSALPVRVTRPPPFAMVCVVAGRVGPLPCV